MEWNKYPETFPITEGKLLVVINNEILVAISKFNSGSYYQYEPNSIVYFFNHTLEHDLGVMKFVPIRGDWIKPKLYAEVTHWMKLPEVPND
jgi:hypothetical protein